MLAAFAIVGACATFAIYNFTLARYENDSRSELLSLAKVVSLQLSPEGQIRLHRKDPQTYHALNEVLMRAQRQAGSVRRMYTIRKRGEDVFETALDTSVSESGALPLSVLSPTPGFAREAKDVFSTGIACVDEELLSDKVGPYFTAYAPLVDSAGRVIAVIAIERDARDIATHIKGLKRAAGLALALVMLLGAIFSLIIVRQLARTSKSEAWLRGATTSTRIFRATILELTLTALAMGVLGLGVYSQLRIGQLRVEENISIEKTKSLDQYRNRLVRVLRDTRRDSNGINILAESSEKDGLTWLSGALRASLRSDPTMWQAPLWQSLTAIQKKAEDERKLRDRIHEATGEMSERMTSALVIAILLSFGSLVLVRSAAKQQQELLIAKHDSQRHQVAYEQVATNLPIGFYTFKDGEIEDSNAMWDTMVTRLSGEDRMMALERTVHEDDLSTLHDAFKSAQDSHQSFHLQFRMHASSTELRNYETRGLWVSKPDEGIDTLLGFFLDVTDLVQVQEQLEARNREVQAKNQMLSQALADLEENLEAMVHGLVRAVEAKDPYTAGHSERVMRYSVSIGEALGINSQQLRVLERGTLIHDVGKIGIPDELLRKSSKLTSKEFDVIKEHPVIGSKMVEGIPVFQECIPIILWHHERLDGRGYPDGLKGEEIPLLVRIASVADVFDALTSTRAYRSAMGIERAIALLRKDAEDGVLDGKIVEVLADIVKRDGVLWGESLDQAA